MLEINRKLSYISPCCFTPKFQVLDIQTGSQKSCFVFFAIDSVTGRILHYALDYGTDELLLVHVAVPRVEEGLVLRHRLEGGRRAHVLLVVLSKQFF